MQNTNTKYNSKNNPTSRFGILRVAVVLALVFCAGGNAIGQVASEILRASKIITCVEMVDWKSFKSPTEFTIGVYGQFAEEVIPLNNLTKRRVICDRPIKIIQFRRKKDMVPTDVLFINSKYNEDLEFLYNKAVDNKSLVITDHAPSDKNFMINLLFQPNGKDFEVNFEACKHSNAGVSEKLTNQGGSTIELKTLIFKQEQELKAKQERLNKSRDSLNVLVEQMNQQIADNERLIHENQVLARELELAEQAVEQEKANAALVMARVMRSQELLVRDKQIIEEQEDSLAKVNELIESTKEDILILRRRLDKRQQDIQFNIAKINDGYNDINRGNRIIYAIVIFLVVVSFLVLLIVKSLRERKRANIKLQQKNRELLQQTQEINEQASQLESINQELEKLSIVAGKTQNAIVIMDRNGYFEWVNAGFTRFFGYTLQLLRNERDENIVNVSSNKSIRNILFKCVSNKQTIVFESDAFTRAGEKIAAQTTLSPILNDKGDVTQLVAIYSDISKLKEQEAAIRSQNEELLQQKNTLEIQKTQIEEQTKSIKSGIYYAKTIQQTILPPTEQIRKYFDCFVLFRPKDIVSGDFYWFSEAQDGDKNYQFVGDFDCTGHGVPGAFMSLIGNRILNEVINVRKTYSPRDIMDNLNANVIKALKQEQTTNNDGMDTCLCRVERISLSEYKVVFCGAKRPLYYLRTTDQEVQELKGDRKSIGGTQKKRGNIQFTDQEIIMHTGDVLILCSDGISDQCDKDRKKFSSDRLRSIILQNRTEDMDTQCALLSKALDDYRGEEEQRDDISVIGIKFR